MTDYMKGASRNPFEIRTNLLQIAQNYLQKQWEAADELARAAFMEQMKQGMAAQADWQKFAPKFYNFEDIVNKARELYGFVNNK